MPALRYVDPAGSEVVLELLEREVLIGRQTGCDIIVPREFVSRRHARVFKETERWVIADAGSALGTFVNGVRTDRKVLEAEDRIAIGDWVIVYTAGLATEFKLARVEPTRDTTTRRSTPAVSSDGTTAPEASSERIEVILTERPAEQGALVQALREARTLDVTKVLLDSSRPSLERIEAPARSAQDPFVRLLGFGEALRQCAEVEAVCTTALQLAVGVSQASRGVLALREGTGATMSDFAIRAQWLGGKVESAPASPLTPSRTFVEKVVRQKISLIARDTGLDPHLSSAHSIVSMDIRSILCAPLWEGTELLGWLYLDSDANGKRFSSEDLDLVSALGHQAAGEIVRLRLVERVQAEQSRRANLARFVSESVIRHIEDEAKAGRLDPTHSASELDVTVLFADIQGFTRLAEGMPAAEVKRFIDSYLAMMTEILLDRHDGTLDKYMGDGVMALFGAPFPRGRKEDATRAVAAAVDIRDTLARLRTERPEFRKLEIRIGVNTGKVIAGMLGSPRRMEYSVIGDTVNVASRLESTAEPGRILIGEATYEAIKDRFVCESAGERRLKNREEPVRCWWVTGKRA